MAHDQEFVGLNPDTVYWMDVSIASYYIIENENKGSQMGHTKKLLKNNSYCMVISTNLIHSFKVKIRKYSFRINFKTIRLALV
jgi:hypothetical protein